MVISVGAFDVGFEQDVTTELSGVLSLPTSQCAVEFRRLVVAAMDDPLREAMLMQAFPDWLAERADTIPVGKRHIIAIAAVDLGAASTVPTLLKWLDGATGAERTFLREVLIDGLGRIGDDRAVPALRVAATHADEWTRFFAREALARIAGEFEESAPVWPGARGLRLAVVGASVWSGPVHLFYKTLMQAAFDEGHYAESYAGWRANGYQRILRDLAFDEQGQPRYTVLILHALQPEQTTGELMWRLYHYVRRGGRLIIDRPSLFWPGENTVYEPGPWDALFPEKLERQPRFPSIDGIPPPRRLARHSPPPLKSLFYGYRQIERGGVLMIAAANRSLTESTAEAVPYAALSGFLEPVSNDVRPALGVAIPQILHWLTEGPTWKPATVDWREEPHDVPIITGGEPFLLPVTVTFHDAAGPLTPRLTLRDPRGGKVASLTGAPVTGTPFESRVEVLSVNLAALSEKGAYALELTITDADGRVIDDLQRGVSVVSKIGLAIAAPPTTETFHPVRLQSPPPYSIQADWGHTPVPVIRRHVAEDVPPVAPVKLTVDGPVGLTVPEGELRLWIVNPDTERRYALWRQPWSGLDRDAQSVMVTFEIEIPSGLPVGQYTWLAEVGDRAGRVFAESTGPLAVPAHYRDRQAMLWQDWAANYEGTPEGAQPRRDIGFNTSHQNGVFRGLDGFPYEYAIINTPPRTVGVHLGNRYIDDRIPNTDRRSMLSAARATRLNAKAMSVNIIDEQSVFDQIDWRPRRRQQIRIFLQNNFGDVQTFNAHAGADIASWEEAFFGMQTGTNKAAIAFLSRWFYYEHRDSVIRMHGDWLREGNPYLQIEPGMGAGGGFYDAMHMRGYVWHNMAWFPKARQTWLGVHGLAQMTWLMGMRSETRFPPMGRVAWSSVAGGGRNMLLYAPGDHLGRRLFHPDGRLTPHGEAYAQVVQAIRPYEPALVHVQNEIREGVLNLGGPGRHLDLLFRMGVQPAQSATLDGRRVILNSHPSSVDGAAVRQAVEAGAICLMIAPGEPRVAAAFGVQLPDASVRGDAIRVDLTPLDTLLPGVAGRSLRGRLGPAVGAVPGSGLQVAPGLLYGRFGNGLFIYLNVALDTLQSYPSEDDPLDLADGVRLMEAVLRRGGMIPTAVAVDVTGEPDSRFAIHTLDTADRAQRYLLVQANDILEGSLASRGLAERESEALARSALPAPVDFGPDIESDDIVLHWDQEEETEAIVWIEREIDALPESPDFALELYLTKDGAPVPARTRDRRTGELDPPTPIGRLRALTAAGCPVWEVAGPFLPLEPGQYELRIRPPADAARTVRVHGACVMPATIMPRVVLYDDRITGLFDMRRQSAYPVQSGDGYRYLDIPLRAGDGAVLSLLEGRAPNGEFPAYRLEARVETQRPRIGHPLTVAAVVRDADGKRVPGSHSLQARLLDGRGQPIPATQMNVLARRGRAVFDFWIGASDPAGPRQLELRDFTTGARTQVTLVLDEPADPSDQSDRAAALSADWSLSGMPLRGGTIEGRVRLTNPGSTGIALDGLTLDAGGADGVTVTPGAGMATVPAGESADIPFRLTLGRDVETGPIILHPRADGLAATDRQALMGLVVNVPPPVEFEIEDFPDLREPDMTLVEITGRVRNRTTTPLTVRLEPNLPESAVLGGATALRITTAPGEWTPIRVPVLLTQAIARRARERDLCVPMGLIDEDGQTLGLARPRLPINPWDVQPPPINAVTGGSLNLAVRNATASRQTVTFSFAPPRPTSRPDSERVAAAAIAVRDPERGARVLEIEQTTMSVDLSPLAMTAVRVPVRYRPAVGSDGIYAVAYQVSAQDGARAEGTARIEATTRSRWWVHTAVGALAPRITTTAIGGLGPEKAAPDPWAPPAGIFEARRPPAGWVEHEFGGGVPLDVLKPSSYSIVTAVTRVIAEAPAEVEIRVAYATPHFLMVDGHVLEDRRTGDERQAAPRGFKPPFFDGQVRLNGRLVYNSRSATPDGGQDDDLLDLETVLSETVADSGTLVRGVNELTIQMTPTVDARTPLGIVYVWFVDPATGARVYLSRMDMNEKR